MKKSLLNLDLSLYGWKKITTPEENIFLPSTPQAWGNAHGGRRGKWHGGERKVVVCKGSMSSTVFSCGTDFSAQQNMPACGKAGGVENFNFKFPWAIQRQLNRNSKWKPRIRLSLSFAIRDFIVESTKMYIRIKNLALNAFCFSRIKHSLLVLITF